MGWRGARRAFLSAVATAAFLGCAQTPEPTSLLENRPPVADLDDLESLVQVDLLNALLEQEKARIAREAELSKAVYDSLKKVWDKYLQASSDDVGVQLVMCDPLQYVGQTKIIGPDGGDLDVGPHKLTIPRGALTAPTVITGEMPVALVASIRFSPHGQQFRRRPLVRLSYKHCQLPNRATTLVAYTDELLTILELPPSYDPGKGDVYAWIDHFSRYAVAW